MPSLYPVLSMFFTPVKTFQSLTCESRYGWIAPFVVCGVLSIVLAWGTAPLLEAIFMNNLPAGIDQTNILATRATMAQQQMISLLTAPLGVLARWFIHAAFLWLFIQLVASPMRFSTILTIVSYAFVVVSLGDMLSLTLTYWHGIQAVKNPLVLLGEFGLNRLIPGTLSMSMESLFRSISLFSIWQLVLLTIGLSVVGGLTRGRAFGVAFATWLFPILLGSATLSFF